MTILNDQHSILEYFNENPDYPESLLISFSYQEKKREMTIISDYTYFERKTVREFRKLTFQGLSFFRRDLGKEERLKPIIFEYNSIDYASIHKLQKLKIRKLNGQCLSAGYFFDLGLGGFEFHFSSLIHHYKVGKAIWELGDWHYYDMSTNEKFDFYKPF